ncbi:hypothetical protein FIV00_19820 [Labrenzia sp. THAF82]|uniref:hypothetical protein n=1 Tax=Labrenzia sp. THAF82 TaxID=2587861 RepID=UPI0012681F78|nr:hypothetical protein [Labrenzia sp. THAF82]QFT32748.1 hypothetical protein FIV00_19820 [Labrenzia sp. THAF82]
MLHTGDIYEIRARAARNEGLRQLVSALTGFLVRSTSRETHRADRSFKFENANDSVVEIKRVA